MKDSIFAKTPAKLNLFLKIIDKRKDGFHNLETVFEKVSLFDDIYISLKSFGIEVISEGFKVPQNSKNIVYKAAELFVSKLSIHRGIKINIKKRIPPGSGMGGGSSDAACILKMLNNLFDTNLSREELFHMGKSLGADVGFFLKDYAFALGKGKGDIIRKVNTDLSFWHLMVKPSFDICTTYAYSLWDKENSNVLTKNKVGVKLLIQALENNEIEKVYRKLYNSFEHILFKKFIDLSKIKKKLLDLGAKNVLLTGSGSIIYGIFSDEEEVVLTKNKLEKDKNFPYAIQVPVQTVKGL